MPAKTVVLEGYGTIMLNSINVKDGDFETVDSEGRPLTYKKEGEGRSFYVNPDGVEVPRSQVCKKIPVEDEEIVASKFEITKQVAQDNINEIDDNGLIYRGLERKFYSVVTDNAKIKDLVLNQNKSLEFPFVAGQGWKIYKGILTAWQGKLLLVGCRGDLQKELDKFADDVVEFEIEAIPQQKNMKKLVKAMAMV